MGTQRQEAFITCRQFELETTDHTLMMTICHKWNDRQVRSLDISFSELLEYMPYRGKKYAQRTLVRSLERLIDLGILFVEHNGRRYLQDRWLHIDIVWQEFWDNLDIVKNKKKEKPVQPQLLQSRALNARPESTRVQRASEGFEIHSEESTRVQRASEGFEIHSHSSTKDHKDLTPSKDQGKAAELQGSTPRPALVPAATLTAPETAEAVYNTLEIPTKEPDMLSQREKEIRTIFYDGLENGRRLGEDRRAELRAELFTIAQQKRLKKEEAHGGNAAQTLHKVREEQADGRVLPQRQRQGGPRVDLHGVPQGQEAEALPGEEEATRAAPVPVLQAEQDGAGIPPA